MNISESIKALPDGMTVAVLREDMVIAELVCTTSHLQRLVTALETVVRDAIREHNRTVRG